MTSDSLVFVDESDATTTNLKNTATPGRQEEEPTVMLGSPMAIVDGVPFSSGDEWTNWASNVSVKPERLFYPSTLEDLQVIIREATENKKKVRCVGTGHSWSGTAVTQDYMVSVNNMNKISPPVQLDDGTWTVTIETGVQVSQLDVFLKEHSPSLALPANVVPTDVRYGGILSMGCHGAALASIISDTLTEITIVNAYGELHIYSEADDAEAFNVACVNLGLLGIIYTATIKVIPMSQYRLRAIDSYETIESFFHGPDAVSKLKEMVLENDSTEIFFWPHARFMHNDKRNDHFWLKQWKRTLDPVEPMDKYMDQPPPVDHPGFAAFRVGEIVKEIPDAIHFDITTAGQGASTHKLLDASAGFKIDADFGNFVEAFNELLDKNWSFSSNEFPSRIGTMLEVRFVRASSKYMSFVYDDKKKEDDLGAVYCLINLLGLMETPGFVEHSADIMTGWMDKYNAKPHWAKMWEHIPGIYPTLRRECKDRLAIVNRVRKTQDPFDMFLNDTWRPLFEELEQ
ncbi:hypothetical protein BGZ95_006619 [Linnemannia exigua]|uniref:D-arabinono-1,4-lactone oxidase n=1 Tax=Linnemannia exigua TaxID=604196 RepID=A0AAD4DL97_9FUNG|nr:hypothetical protein BGZ95_006619 [Linnemannia exigua]